MSARTDIIAWLDTMGYPANRAILCEEGSGTAEEHFSGDPITEGGTPGWTTDGTYGTAVRLDAVGDYIALVTASDFISTTGQTVIIARKAHDTTLRQSYLFAVNVAVDANRCSAHAPWDDGDVYWDFGGISGDNRLLWTTYAKSTDFEVWVFKAGASGSQIWLNGVLQASHANSISRSTDTGLFQVNAGFLINGDLQDVFSIILVPDEVPDSMLEQLTPGIFSGDEVLPTDVGVVAIDETGFTDGQPMCSIVEALSATVPAESLGLSDGQPTFLGSEILMATAPAETLGLADSQPEPDTPPTEPPTGSDIYVPQAASGAFFGDRPLLLVRIALATGEEFVSDIPVSHPSWDYEPEVLQWGDVERAIPIPPGPPIINGGSLTLSDSPDENGVQRWRQNLDEITGRRKTITLKSGFEGGRESLFPTPYVGELLSPTFPADRVVLPFRDRWDRWLKQQIPGLINRVNYPNLPPGLDEAFGSIVFGCVTSLEVNKQGVLPLHLCDTATNDYFANQTISNRVCAVYRKLPTEQVFTKLSCDFGYSMVIIPRTIGNITYHTTMVRMPEAQPDGTVLRCDLDGASVRGQFGTMEGVSGTLRNIVDHTINLLYYLFALQGEEVEFDTPAFAAARQRYEDLGLKFDGAFTQPMSFGSALSQLMTCGNFWLYPNRYGQITIKAFV